MYILIQNKATKRYSIGYILGPGLPDAEYYLYTRSHEFLTLREVRKEAKLLMGFISVNLEEDFKLWPKKEYLAQFSLINKLK